MSKRIALGGVLLIATALATYVWADEGCENCGGDWQAASDEQATADDAGILAGGEMSIMSAYKTAIIYCHSNHGGAESETSYQNDMVEGGDYMNLGLTQLGLGQIVMGNGNLEMSNGNNECPADCQEASARYGIAWTAFNSAVVRFASASGYFCDASYSFHMAADELVAEEDGEPCACEY